VVSAGEGEETPDRLPTPTPPDPEEAAAIVRAQQGETEQFELLVRRYMRGAFAVAFRLLGHRQDAEDVVQEAMLAALANIRTFDTTRRFGPWLYRIVVTRGLNFRKSRARRQTESLDRDQFASAEAGPAVGAERAALREAVQDALARLPERQRMVVQLFELDGFSGAEIAAMLGIPPGTVRWHLHEARRSLRDLLAQFEESAG
jgi:RNA polymerase sigma-70 factor, ECF subfamily